MEWSVTHQYLDYSGEEICENCGCKFHIKVFKQAGHNEREEYRCPDCGKAYFIRACNTPEIHKICSKDQKVNK